MTTAGTKGSDVVFSDVVALGLSMPCISIVDVHHSDFLDAFPELDKHPPLIASLKYSSHFKCSSAVREGCET